MSHNFKGSVTLSAPPSERTYQLREQGGVDGSNEGAQTNTNVLIEGDGSRGSPPALRSLETDGQGELSRTLLETEENSAKEGEPAGNGVHRADTISAGTTQQDSRQRVISADVPTGRIHNSFQYTGLRHCQRNPVKETFPVLFSSFIKSLSQR